MTVTQESPGYKVDRRVSIALDALDPEEQETITAIIKDRAHFLANTADRRKVRRISQKEPFYALTIPYELRIIDSQVGDDIVVMDLMHRLNLAENGPRQPAKATRKDTRTVHTASRAVKAK